MISFLPGRRIGTVERYVVAVTVAVIGVAALVLLHRHIGSSLDALLVLVVAFSAWYGGFGPGVVTLLLLGAGAWLTLRPGSPGTASPVDALPLLVYGVTGLLVSGLIASLLRARRRAERAAARTERLHALNLALAPALSPDEVSAIIIRHAMEALQARAGAIIHGDSTDRRAVRSPDHPGDPDHPEGPLAEVVREGRPVFVESAARLKARYPAAARADAAGSVVAVPFLTGGRVTGGLELEFGYDRRIAPEDGHFILTLAGQGAQALERARLYEAERLARHRAEAAHEQVEFLAEASHVLASSLDYRATLAATARLAVPRLADWCAVDIVDVDGRHRRLAIAHADPAKVEAVWAMSHRYPEAPQDPVPQVIRTAKPQLISEIPDGLLRAFARDENHLQALRAFGLRSLLIVPLIARGRILGAITFVLAESERRFTAADLPLAEDLARRAATAVDNARLHLEVEQALGEQARSLALLDTVFQGTAIGLAFVDRALRFVRVNEALAAVSGVPHGDHAGRTVSEVLGDLADQIVPLVDEVFRTGQPILDQEIAREPVSEVEGARIYLVSCYPVAVPSQDTQSVACMLTDVTERRRAAELLAQAERMEAVARVAGGVAHEVNNMMTVITGFSGMVESAMPAGDPRVDDLAEIRRAADRAAGITRQLLAYSRQQLLQPTALDLNAMVQESLPMLAGLVGSGVAVQLRPSIESAQVRVDRNQLEQVLVNLAINARDAMAGHGTLAIAIDQVVVEAGQRVYAPGVRMTPGRYVRLSVSDTGHGMDAATRAKVFEPFFTTKVRGQGSGLGLATVYGVVKQSGGYIWVYSEVGQGTAFKIYLPEFTGPLAEAPPVPPPVSPRGAERILIVEDEAAVRRMVGRALAAQGYAVLEAENGAEALEVLTQAEGPVDLVLRYVVSPVLNGRELAERLAAERPRLRVLFMSGYTDDDVIRRGLLDPGAPFLQKPFMAADLARKVREVLDAR